GLDESAIAAAKKLRFTPAKKNGVPFRAPIKYQFNFTLKEKVVEPSRATGQLGGIVLVQRDETPLDGAVVSAEPVETSAEPYEGTRRTIERREIERIPGTNGDALRSIQNLPGVARPPGIFGALLIRGSGPQDTQTFIDGIYVPIIYHFGGLSSVVPTELLSK